MIRITISKIKRVCACALPRLPRVEFHKSSKVNSTFGRFEKLTIAAPNSVSKSTKCGDDSEKGNLTGETSRDETSRELGCICNEAKADRGNVREIVAKDLPESTGLKTDVSLLSKTTSNCAICDEVIKRIFDDETDIQDDNADMQVALLIANNLTINPEDIDQRKFNSENRLPMQVFTNILPDDRYHDKTITKDRLQSILFYEVALIKGPNDPQYKLEEEQEEFMYTDLHEVDPKEYEGSWNLDPALRIIKDQNLPEATAVDAYWTNIYKSVVEDSIDEPNQAVDADTLKVYRLLKEKNTKYDVTPAGTNETQVTIAKDVESKRLQLTQEELHRIIYGCPYEQDFVHHATTVKEEEEQLAQKIEKIDETPLVEAQTTQVEGFNIFPKVLGKDDAHEADSMKSDVSRTWSMAKAHKETAKMLKNHDENQVIVDPSKTLGCLEKRLYATHHSKLFANVKKNLELSKTLNNKNTDTPDVIGTEEQEIVVDSSKALKNLDDNIKDDKMLNSEVITGKSTLKGKEISQDKVETHLCLVNPSIQKQDDAMTTLPKDASKMYLESTAKNLENISLLKELEQANRPVSVTNKSPVDVSLASKPDIRCKGSAAYLKESEEKNDIILNQTNKALGDTDSIKSVDAKYKVIVDKIEKNNVKENSKDQNIKETVDLTTNHETVCKPYRLEKAWMSDQLDPKHVLTCNETCSISPKSIMSDQKSHVKLVSHPNVVKSVIDKASTDSNMDKEPLLDTPKDSNMETNSSIKNNSIKKYNLITASASKTTEKNHLTGPISSAGGPMITADPPMEIPITGKAPLHLKETPVEVNVAPTEAQQPLAEQSITVKKTQNQSLEQSVTAEETQQRPLKQHISLMKPHDPTVEVSVAPVQDQRPPIQWSIATEIDKEKYPVQWLKMETDKKQYLKTSESTKQKKITMQGEHREHINATCNNIPENTLVNTLIDTTDKVLSTSEKILCQSQKINAESKDIEATSKQITASSRVIQAASQEIQAASEDLQATSKQLLASTQKFKNYEILDRDAVKLTGASEELITKSKPPNTQVKKDSELLFSKTVPNLQATNQSDLAQPFKIKEVNTSPKNQLGLAPQSDVKESRTPLKRLIESNEVSLSILLRKVRERNRLEAKLKKPVPFSFPSHHTRTIPTPGYIPLKPMPKICVPKKKPKKSKFSRCDLKTLGLDNKVGPRMTPYETPRPNSIHDANQGIAIANELPPSGDLTEEIIVQLQTFGQVLETVYRRGKTQVLETAVLAKSRSNLFKPKDFEPWVPIPSWPHSKKELRQKLQCPKDGCKTPPPKCMHDPPCGLRPCDTFPAYPKRSFSLLDYVSVSLNKHEVTDLD